VYAGNYKYRGAPSVVQYIYIHIYIYVAIHALASMPVWCSVMNGGRVYIWTACKQVNSICNYKDSSVCASAV